MKYTSAFFLGLLILLSHAVMSPALATKVELGADMMVVREEAEPTPEPYVETPLPQAVEAQKIPSVEEQPAVVEKTDVELLPMAVDEPKQKTIKDELGKEDANKAVVGEADPKALIIEELLIQGMPLVVPHSDNNISVLKANTRFDKDLGEDWVIFPEWYHMALLEDNMFVIPFVHGQGNDDITYYLSLLEFDSEGSRISFHGTYLIGQYISDLIVTSQAGVLQLLYKEAQDGKGEPVERNLDLILEGHSFKILE